MKRERDFAAALQGLLQQYRATELDWIATNPEFREEDLENHLNSYKYLRLQVPDDQLPILAEVSVSDILLFPNDVLAMILLEVLRRGLPKGIQLTGLSIERIENSLSFCISGATFLEYLQTAYESLLPSSGLGDET